MLHYELANLSAVEALRLDTACALRLELDRSAAAQARGEGIDIKALTSAAEALERLLHPAEAPGVKPRTDGRERLKALIEATILAGPAKPSAETARLAELEAEVTRLRAELELARAGGAPPAAAPVAPDTAVSAEVVPLRQPPSPRTLSPTEVAERIDASMQRKPEPWDNSYSTGRGIHSIPRNF
jgi:hypothetical protein